MAIASKPNELTTVERSLSGEENLQLMTALDLCVRGEMIQLMLHIGYFRPS
jgi:hypothetical protein